MLALRGDVSRKPQAGSCGRCGRAVVRPTKEEIARAIDINPWGLTWVRGHRFVEDKLDMVRCPDHERAERPEFWDELEVV